MNQEKLNRKPIWPGRCWLLTLILLATIFLTGNTYVADASIAIPKTPRLGEAAPGIGLPSVFPRSSSFDRIILLADDSSMTSIIDQTPAAGATGVKVDQDIIFRFSDAMDASTINQTTVYLTGEGSTIYLTPSYDPVTHEVKIIHSKLAFNREYYVNVTNNVKDSTGKRFTGSYWNFTTSNEYTYSASVSDRDPDYNSINVSLDKVIRFRLNAAAKSESVNDLTVYLTRGETSVACKLEYDSSSHMVAMSPEESLTPSTTYTVHVGSNIIDYEGEHLLPATWSFTTGVAWTAPPPKISQRDPEAGAKSVPVNKVIKFNFDTAMNVASINQENILLSAPGSTIPCRVSYDSNSRQVLITPDSALKPGTEYTIRLSGLIKDNNDQYINSASWNFTTVAPSPLQITVRSPADGSSNVPVQANIKIIFNNQLDPASLSGENFSVLNAETLQSVLVTMFYDNTKKEVILTPVGNLAGDTGYTIKLSNSIADLNGGLLGNIAWKFHTGHLVGTAAHPQVVLNNKYVQFTDSLPCIIKGRTLLPFRPVLEAMGASVAWDPQRQEVKTSLQGNTISFVIGKNQAIFNGLPIELEVGAQIINGRTLIPLRFAADCMRLKTEWHPDTYTVVLDQP